MKRKKKNVLQIISLLLCLAFIIAIPTKVNAEEHSNEGSLYYDTEQGRFVNEIDEYLAQLNAEMITPYNSTITNHAAIDHGSMIMPLSLSEPSKKCSNISGHKWGSWDCWEEVTRYHFTTGKCMVVMERWHYCSRTHCGASQTERDCVWVNCTH